MRTAHRPATSTSTLSLSFEVLAYRPGLARREHPGHCADPAAAADDMLGQLLSTAAGDWIQTFGSSPGQPNS